MIDVLIAFLEYANPESLAEYEAFYTIATDVSSLLSVISAAIRLPIYIANDKLIRQEVSLFKLDRHTLKARSLFSCQFIDRLIDKLCMKFNLCSYKNGF